MDTLTITYRIQQGKRKPKIFDFVLDAQTGDLQATPPETPEPWTALTYRQCPDCPLDPAAHPHCPVALQFQPIVEAFSECAPIDEVNLEVITAERKLSQTVELQQVIESMLGMFGPASGCPKMSFLKPLARFHTPLASEEEALFRIAACYALSQSLQGKVDAKWKGLEAIYDDLHEMNRAFAHRLAGATLSDVSKNAIALLDMYSKMVPMMVEDQLQDVEALYAAYRQYPPAEKKTSLKNFKAEDLQLQALMDSVEVDELEALLGTQKIDAVKETDQPKPKFGRATFKLADDPQ